MTTADRMKTQNRTRLLVAAKRTERLWLFLLFLVVLMGLIACWKGDVLAQDQEDRRAVEQEKEDRRAVEQEKEDRRAVEQEKNASNQAVPFGNNLFQGQFGADQRIGLNPNYQVQPGDEIAVAMWGAVDFNERLTVDKQGNLFLPKIGPIPVQGVLYSNLTQHVKKHVRKHYTENVNMYLKLLGTQPIAVYVTGAVPSPGRYSGEASNSVLHYLDMAQGIDPRSGSFRRIDILRSNEVIAKVDLYDFLRHGDIPKVQLHEGDTILVHPQGMTVSAQGAVTNEYQFEFMKKPVQGEGLMELATPLPEATHALVEGMRSGTPFSSYMSLDEFASSTLKDGDQVTFKQGEPKDRLLITIEGQHKGPKTMVTPEDSELLEVLRQVPVNPDLANTDAVYLRRENVASRQKEALEESLRRLESSVLSTGTMTEAQTEIQTQQLKMIQDFISRARNVEPEGRMVLSTEEGIRNVLLEDGDTIVVPRKTNLVHINGEVLMPRATVHQEGKDVDFYIDRAGGLTQRADDDRIVIIRANGEAVTSAGAEIRPGDEIMVLPKIPTNFLQVTKDVADILYKIAITASVPLRF